MRKILYILLSATALFLVSCTKEEDDIELDASKSAMLQQNYWRMFSLTYNADINEPTSPVLDQYQFLNDCTKDNVWSFTSNSNLGVDEHYLKCNINDPQVHEYFYGIESDNYLKIWSNSDDPGASIMLQGKILTPSHDTFYVEFEQWNEATEKTTRTITGFQKFKY